MPTFPVFINASRRRAKALPALLVGFELIRFFEVKTGDLGLVDKLLDLNAGGSLRSNLAELLVRKDYVLILEARLWLSVAEYSRTGMLTRPKAIDPFQMDFI